MVHFTASDERKARGVEALNKYFAQSLVFIGEGPAVGLKEPRANGTGTLIITPERRIAVLTAKHVLEDDPPSDGFTLGGPAIGTGGLHLPFVRHWSHPAVDVAIALLTEHAGAVFGASAVPHDRVAEIADELTEDDDAFICGFPAAYRLFEVDKRTKIIEQHMHSLVYRTGVTGPDASLRYRVTWSEGVVDRADGRHALFDIEEGKPFKQKHPGGVSGGPLWKVSPVGPRRVVGTRHSIEDHWSRLHVRWRD